MSKQAGVVFDLDGTLVDSAPGICAAMTATGLARRPVSVERVRRLVSFGAEQLIGEAMGLPDAELGAALATFRRLYADAPCSADHLYPGVAAGLAALVDRGVALGICTNKPQRLAEIVVSRLGLEECVRVVVGSSPDRPDKPHPGPLLEVLARLAADGPRVFVGDSTVDADAASAADIPFVFAAYGYGSYEGRPAASITQFADLRTVLPRLLCGGTST